LSSTRETRSGNPRLDESDAETDGEREWEADRRKAIAMLEEWMRFEDLDYYRIYTPFTGRLPLAVFPLQ